MEVDSEENIGANERGKRGCADGREEKETLKRRKRRLTGGKKDEKEVKYVVRYGSKCERKTRMKTRRKNEKNEGKLGRFTRKKEGISRWSERRGKE